MPNVCFTRFCLRFVGSAGAALSLLLGGCATLNAPYEYTVVGTAGTPSPQMESYVLPPGSFVGSDTVTFVVEHNDASPSCLLVPKIIDEKSQFRISAVYWQEIGKRGTRVDVSREAACKEYPGLRECMKEAGKKVMAEIAVRPEWNGCEPPMSSLEASYPYLFRESLRDDLGFTFVSKEERIEVNTEEFDPSNPATPRTATPNVIIVRPGEVSSVNVRPGMQVCVQAEQGLTPSDHDRSKQATPEHCAKFVGAGNGLLAIPGLDKWTPTAYTLLHGAEKDKKIYGVRGWSGIRSYAIEKLGNAFQLTVYFPRSQAMNHKWEQANPSWILDDQTSDAGPLLLLSGEKRDMPPGRQVTPTKLCGSSLFSCFIFMDRPSVRITQNIRLNQQMLEAELGMTLSELVVSESLPPVELYRDFRGRPIPVRGNAYLVPLVRGDALRILHD